MNGVRDVQGVQGLPGVPRSAARIDGPSAGFGALLGSEIRRALARRVTKMLVLLALGGVVLMGIILFVHAGNVDNPAFLGSDDPYYLTALWPDFGTDGLLLVTGVYLVFGAVLGAASVAGGEWKFGTMTTLLTWEPRRLRAVAARFLAVGLCAAMIAIVLQALVVGVALLVAITRGSTEGADGAWVVDLVGGASRGIAVIAIAAVAGAAVAFIGRSTTAAIGSAFLYLAVIENLIRGLRPGWRGWLLAENAGAFLSGEATGLENGIRTATDGTLIVIAYMAIVVTVAVQMFRRRDIAAVS